MVTGQDDRMWRLRLLRLLAGAVFVAGVWIVYADLFVTDLDCTTDFPTSQCGSRYEGYAALGVGLIVGAVLVVVGSFRQAAPFRRDSR
jgi:hypothetical protein